MPLVRLDYFSHCLEKSTQCLVILPDRQIKPPYPVMFLLHGLSDDYTIWQRRTSIERYVEGTPWVVVMPDGGRSFYVDASEGFAYGSAIGKELPDVIQHYFPVTNQPWAITGLSMGGYGAFRLALANPDRFGSAHSHSGAMGFGQPGFRDDIPEFQRILGSQPQGGPADLRHLVTTASPLPALRFDCGVDDFLIQDNRSFRDFLVSEKIPHEYEEYAGEHTWSYWDLHVQEALAFHKKSLNL